MQLPCKHKRLIQSGWSERSDHILNTVLMLCRYLCGLEQHCQEWTIQHAGGALQWTLARVRILRNVRVSVA